MIVNTYYFIQRNHFSLKLARNKKVNELNASLVLKINLQQYAQLTPLVSK